MLYNYFVNVYEACVGTLVHCKRFETLSYHMGGGYIYPQGDGLCEVSHNYLQIAKSRMIIYERLTDGVAMTCTVYEEPKKRKVYG